MKLKSIFAAAAFCVALSSCGPKEKPLAEQLVGQWTGMDSITVTTVDSTGTPTTTTMVCLIELEYLADSTFTAVIAINDSTKVDVKGDVIVNETAVNFTGSLVCADKTLDLNGALNLQGADTLKVQLTGVKAEKGINHDGKATLTRKAVQQ